MWPFSTRKMSKHQIQLTQRIDVKLDGIVVVDHVHLQGLRDLVMSIYQTDSPLREDIAKACADYVMQRLLWNLQQVYPEARWEGELSIGPVTAKKTDIR